MSHDIIIDKNGAPQHLNVDRLRVKNGSGTVDYAPPTRRPYAKLIVYRNGTYNAEDYGLEAFEGVEARVGSRRDGRACDVVWPDDELSGESQRQIILEGGQEKHFDAKALAVKMGQSDEYSQYVNWLPVEEKRTPEQGTIQHNGTRRGLYSSVTLDVPESEMEYPIPPDYRRENSGAWLKVRGELHDHFWAYSDPVTDKRTYYPITNIRTSGEAAYRCDMDVSFVSVCSMMRSAGRFYDEGYKTYLYPNARYSYVWLLKDYAYNPTYTANFNIVDTLATNGTRKGVKLLIENGMESYKFGEGVMVQCLRVRLKLYIYAAMPVLLTKTYRRYSGDITEDDLIREEKAMPERMFEIDKNIEFDQLAVTIDGYEMYAYYRDPDDDFFAKLSVFSPAMQCVLTIYDLGTIKYVRDDGSEFNIHISRYLKNATDNFYPKVAVPITDILYLGPEAEAPDWAKTISDYDF